MRLILVKPTNATRRLDSTGEVFRDRDHDHFTSGGPSPLTKNAEDIHDRHPRVSLEASSSAQETSLCCFSPAPHEKPNDICSQTVSAPMSQLESQNITLSQLGDQDWLLLCDQVNSGADDSLSVQRPGTGAGPKHSDGCGCSCPDAHRQNRPSELCQPQSKIGPVQNSTLSNRTSLSSSPHSQLFSQTMQSSTHCQVLAHKTKQSDLLKHAKKHPQGNFTPQSPDREGHAAVLRQQPCNRFKVKNSQAACPDLFNIPLNSTECSETHQQPASAPDHSWKELFDKEPMLVQTHQKKDSRWSVSGEEIWTSSRDPSVTLQCCHLPYNPLTASPQTQRSPTPGTNTSFQSLSASLYSSLDKQDLTEDRVRQPPRQVQDP